MQRVQSPVWKLGHAGSIITLFHNETYLTHILAGMFYTANKLWLCIFKCFHLHCIEYLLSNQELSGTKCSVVRCRWVCVHVLVRPSICANSSTTCNAALCGLTFPPLYSLVCLSWDEGLARRGNMKAFWRSLCLRQEVYCLLWWSRKTRDMASGGADTHETAVSREEAEARWQEVRPCASGDYCLQGVMGWLVFDNSSRTLLLDISLLGKQILICATLWIIQMCRGLIPLSSRRTNVKVKPLDID